MSKRRGNRPLPAPDKPTISMSAPTGPSVEFQQGLNSNPTLTNFKTTSKVHQSQIEADIYSLPRNTCVCGRTFPTSKGVSNHSRYCPVLIAEKKLKPSVIIDKSSWLKCSHCQESFASFPGVRLHERRKHPAEFNQQLESKAMKSEADIFIAIAEIESSLPVGCKVFLQRMVDATGLTKDMIRHRREKPIYKDYLELIRKERLRNVDNADIEIPKVNVNNFTSPLDDVRVQSISLTKSLPVSLSCRTRNKSKCVNYAHLSAISSNASSSTPSDVYSSSSSDFHISSESSLNSSSSSIVSINSSRLSDALSKSEESVFEPPSYSNNLETLTNQASLSNKNTNIIDRAISLPVSIKLSNFDNNFIESMKLIKHLSLIDKTFSSINNELGSSVVIHPSISSSPGIHFSQVAGPSGYNPLILPDHVNSSILQIIESTEPVFNIPNPPLFPSLSASDSTSLVHNVLSEIMCGDYNEKLKLLASIAVDGCMQNTLVAVDGFITSLFPKNNKRNFGNNKPQNIVNNNNNNNKYHYGRTVKSNDKRASEYKKAQDLYAKSRHSLVDKIIRGESLIEDSTFPSIEHVSEHFSSLFERSSPVDDKTFDCVTESEQMILSITPEEIQKAKFGWSNSAPGPDGLTTIQVKNMPNNILAAFFNVILFTGVVPSSWRVSRTILIHKDGDRLDPSNWRPLTISSSLMRLFHRVLTFRINSFVDMNTNQRGFRDVDGTMANCLILESYVQHRRAQGKSYSILTLDIKKAFDSVSHWSILRALKRFRISKVISNYIMNNIISSKTTIKVGNKCTGPISLNRGVKQGDPLSPLLFNLIIDELLCDLERKMSIGGTVVPGFKIPALAFADDIVLLEDNEINIPITIGIVTDFCRDRGMSLNASKCSALVAISNNKRIVIRSSNSFKIDNQKIRDISTLDSFKYLGREFSGHGVNKPNNTNLASWLTRLDRAPLKPDQKACIIKQFIVPKILYGLQNAKVTSKILRESDRLIKFRFKKYLHLSSHTLDQYLYASIKDGGLGLTHLRYVIPNLMLSRINNLKDSFGDVALKHTLDSSFIVTLCLKLSRLAGPQSPREFWRQRIIGSTFSKGLEACQEDVASRSWLYAKPHGWSGRDFVRAVQLRTNNLPTAGLPSNPVELRRCRGGCAKVETICHVLQGCPVTHHPRISRHNEIVKKIENHCHRQGWNVDVEPHVRHPSGQLFRPDLVIHQENQSVVCDIQISWDGDRSLEDIFNAKERVYNNKIFLEAAGLKWPNIKFIVSPFIVGCRGVFPRSNYCTIDLLKIKQPLKNSTVHSVLKWGSSIHSYFMRHVSGNNRTGGGYGSVNNGSLNHNRENHTILSQPTILPSFAIDRGSKSTNRITRNNQNVRPNKAIVESRTRKPVVNANDNSLTHNVTIVNVNEVNITLLSKLNDPYIFDLVRLYLAYLYDREKNICIKGETKNSSIIKLRSLGLPTEVFRLRLLYLRHFNGFGMTDEDAILDLNTYKEYINNDH